MTTSDRTRVLVVAAADAIDRDVVVALMRGTSCTEARVVATAHVAGRLTVARDQLDGIINLLAELEIPATGTIGDKDADPLGVADAEIARWPADEIVLLIDAGDDVTAWEHAVAAHDVLRHGCPVAVIRGSAQDLTAA